MIGDPGEEIKIDAADRIEEQPLVDKELKSENIPNTLPVQSQSLKYPVAPISSEKPHASPLARSMAADLGIDLRLVQGTGPGGRITKKDIVSFRPKQIVTLPDKPPISPAKPSFVLPGKFIRETLLYHYQS